LKTEKGQNRKSIIKVYVRQAYSFIWYQGNCWGW